MRSSAAAATSGPASLTTMRRIGVPSSEASAMPSSPPIDVPTQSTASTPSRATSVTASFT